MLKVISLILTKPVPRKIQNNWKLDFILISIRLIMEQTERKCKIPKKIKLLLSKIKVSIEMAIEIVIKLNMRFTILDLQLFDIEMAMYKAIMVGPKNLIPVLLL